MDDSGVIDSGVTFAEPLAYEVVAASAPDSGPEPLPELVTTPERFLDRLGERPSPLAGTSVGFGAISFAERLSTPFIGGLISFDPLARMGSMSAALSTERWLSYLSQRYGQLAQTFSWVDRVDIAFLPIEPDEEERLAVEIARRQKEEQQRQKEKNWYQPWSLFAEERAATDAAQARQRKGQPPRPLEQVHQRGSRQEARLEVVRQRAQAELERREQEQAVREARQQELRELQQERAAAQQLASEEQRQARLTEIAAREQQQRQRAEDRRQQELARLIATEEQREALRERAVAVRSLGRLTELAAEIPDRGLARWLTSLSRQARTPSAPLPEQQLLAEATRQVELAHRQLLAARAAVPATEQPPRFGVQRRLDRLAGLARALPDQNLGLQVEFLAAIAADPQATLPDERALQELARRIEAAYHELSAARREHAAAARQAPGDRPAQQQPLARQQLEQLQQLARQIPDETVRGWLAALVRQLSLPTALPLDASQLASITRRLEQARQQAAEAGQLLAAGSPTMPALPGAREQAEVRERLSRLAELARESTDATFTAWVQSLLQLAGEPGAPLPTRRVLEEAILRAERSRQVTLARSEPAGERATIVADIERLARLATALDSAELIRWVQSIQALARDPQAQLPARGVIAEALERAELAARLPVAAGEPLSRDAAAAPARSATLELITRLRTAAHAAAEPTVQRWAERLQQLAGHPDAPLPEAAELTATIARLEQRAHQATTEQRAQASQRATALLALERLTALSRQLADHPLARWVSSLNELASDPQAPLPAASSLTLALRQLEQAAASRARSPEAPAPEQQRLFQRRLTQLGQRATDLGDPELVGWLTAIAQRATEPDFTPQPRDLARLGQLEDHLAQVRRTARASLRPLAPRQQDLLARLQVERPDIRLTPTQLRSLLAGTSKPEELGLDLTLPPAVMERPAAGLPALAGSLRLLQQLGFQLPAEAGEPVRPPRAADIQRAAIPRAELERLVQAGILPATALRPADKPVTSAPGHQRLAAMGVADWVDWDEDVPPTAAGVWRPLANLATAAPGTRQAALPRALQGLVPPGLASPHLDASLRLEGPGTGRQPAAAGAALPEIARYFRWNPPADPASGPAAGYLSWLDWSVAETAQATRQESALAAAVLPRLPRGAAEPAAPPPAAPAPPAASLVDLLTRAAHDWPAVAELQRELRRSELTLGAVIASRPTLLDELARTLALATSERGGAPAPLEALLDRPVRLLPAEVQQALGEAVASPHGRQEALRRALARLPHGLARAGSQGELLATPTLDAPAPGITGRKAEGFGPRLLDEIREAVASSLAAKAASFLPPGMRANDLLRSSLAELETEVSRALAALPADVTTAELGLVARRLTAPLAERLLARVAATGEQPPDAAASREAFAGELPSFGFLGFPFMPPLANEVDRRLESGMLRLSATGAGPQHYFDVLAEASRRDVPGALIHLFGDEQAAAAALMKAGVSLDRLKGTLGYLAPETKVPLADLPSPPELRRLRSTLAAAGLPAGLADTALDKSPDQAAQSAGRLLLQLLQREQLKADAGSPARVRAALAAVSQLPGMADLLEEPTIRRLLERLEQASEQPAKKPTALPGIGLLGRPDQLPAGISLAELGVEPAAYERAGLGPQLALLGKGRGSLASELSGKGRQLATLVELDRFSTVSAGKAQPEGTGPTTPPGGVPPLVARQLGGGGEPMIELEPALQQSLGGRTISQPTLRRIQRMFPRGVPGQLLQKVAQRFPTSAPSDQALEHLVAEVAAEQAGGPVGQAARVAEQEAMASQLATRAGIGGAADLAILRTAFAQLGRGILTSLQHLPHRASGGLSRELLDMVAGDEPLAASSVIARMKGAGFHAAALADEDEPSSPYPGPGEELARTLVEPPGVPEETRREIEEVKRQQARAVAKAWHQRKDLERAIQEQQRRQEQQLQQRKSTLRRTLELAEALFPHRGELSQFAHAPAERLAFPAFLGGSGSVDLTLVAPMAQEIELQAAPLYSKGQQETKKEVARSPEEEKAGGVLLGDKAMGKLDEQLSPQKIDDMATRLMLEVQLELLEANDVRGIQPFQGK